MTWFEDLSPYTFLRTATAAQATLNVGWLARDVPFAIGEPSAALCARLHLLAGWSPTQITRGYHYCDFCPPTVDDDAQPSGHAEIRAVAGDGTRFAAPTLVAHYIEAHRYQPPPAFVAAVLRAADLDRDTAWRDDLCLACASPLRRIKNYVAHRGPTMHEVLVVDFACDACGAEYARDALVSLGR